MKLSDSFALTRIGLKRKHNGDIRRKKCFCFRSIRIQAHKSGAFFHSTEFVMSLQWFRLRLHWPQKWQDLICSGKIKNKKCEQDGGATHQLSDLICLMAL